MDKSNPQKQYEMTEDEIQNVQNFLEEIKAHISPDRLPIFEEFIKHLCEVQDPYNKRYPFIDNVVHGVEVARLCMMKKPQLSEALLLSAVGHDWDRACGDRRIKSTDFPNTDEGNKQYKEAHALNSANLFSSEMHGRFQEDLIKKVYDMILKHEIGGDGELGTLDFADGMVFFSPKTTDYYRNGRMYVGEEGRKLSPEELEEERKKGFATKVKFMSETLSEEDKKFLTDYLQKNRDNLNKVVRDELDELLG